MSGQVVIYTGNFRLYPADAAGRRVLSLAMALSLGGATVRLLPRLGAMPVQFCAFDQDEDYDREVKNGEKFSFSRLLRALNDLKRGDAIILYNPSNGLALATRGLAGLRGIVSALDLTEWYEYSHLPSLRSRVEVFLRMNVTYRLFSRMIFIGDFLADFYRPKIGRIIPPLLHDDVEDIISLPAPAVSQLRILYAGFPGRKDRIDLLMRWLTEARLPIPVQLTLAGPRQDQLPPIKMAKADLRIVALGPIDRRRIFELYMESHLSAIIRDDARYEWAGFPTKAVESWACGVPVLTMSHARFAVHARGHGAAVDLDVNDPVGSLEKLLADLVHDETRLTAMSNGAIHLVNDQHRVKAYISSMKDIVSKMVTGSGD